jgi:hypothetical protein
MALAIPNFQSSVLLNRQFAFFDGQGVGSARELKFTFRPAALAQLPQHEVHFY